jgi:AcrR family transcriptional regulator
LSTTRSDGGPEDRPYHHGGLRRELLESAAAIAAAEGPSAITLRDLARRAGVSHAAPAHHFGDKRGLLTALAAEGFQDLAAGLVQAHDRGGQIVDQGVAYVGFAVAHPGHFAVMWRFDLLDGDDEGLRVGAGAARAALDAGAARHAAEHGGDPRAVATAAWSFAHGLATLLNAGLLDPGPDLAGFVRDAGRALAQGT